MFLRNSLDNYRWTEQVYLQEGRCKLVHRPDNKWGTLPACQCPFIASWKRTPPRQRTGLCFESPDPCASKPTALAAGLADAAIGSRAPVASAIGSRFETEASGTRYTQL